ncbi:MAG: prealbumin-like fold domain-containing protein [Clostridia bacterium]
MKEQKIKVTEISVPEEYYIDKDNCTRIVEIKFGETTMIEFQNQNIKVEIIVKKYSSEDNKYTSISVKSPLRNVVFEIIDSNNKVVDTLTTNSNGTATSKTLLHGKYKLREKIKH